MKHIQESPACENLVVEEPTGRNVPFNPKKYKNLFSQARSSRFLYVVYGLIM